MIWVITEPEEITKVTLLYTGSAPLKIRAYDLDPLEPIREVYEKWKKIKDNLTKEVGFEIYLPFEYQKDFEKDVWSAIQEAMKRCNAQDARAE